MKDILIARSLKLSKRRRPGIFDDPDAVFPAALASSVTLLFLSISLLLNVVLLYANTELWIDNFDMRAGLELMRHNLEPKPKTQGEKP